MKPFRENCVKTIVWVSSSGISLVDLSSPLVFYCTDPTCTTGNTPIINSYLFIYETATCVCCLKPHLCCLQHSFAYEFSIPRPFLVASCVSYLKKKENPCIPNKSHSTIGLILEYNYGPMVGKISHVWVPQN